MVSVTMTCMTKKEKFEVEDPEVVVLSNGRFAFKAECPWLGKRNQTLTAYKFCSRSDYESYLKKNSASQTSEGISEEGE
jgi:hypothetical protein